MEGSHTYDISPDEKWAIHRYSRADDPPRGEVITLPDHRQVRSLFDNQALRVKVNPLVAHKTQFLQVDVGGGVVLDGWTIGPAHLDRTRKYPLLLYVYGEPWGQTVTDEWSTRSLFHRALADDGYIVASFDNRGTPAPKGRDWRKVIFGSIGPLAAAEQTAAVKKLCDMRPYIDTHRIGVWGWSGGGTNTLNLMFRSPELFKVGMAVAPVPDQRLYDTVYQERYMGRPQDNPDGYQKGSAINFATGLRGELLLVHGTGDDNVHFQGSQMLINKLVELGKPFQFMEYPNRTHAISEGKGTTLHLYTLLANYLTDHLPPGPANP
jgi:dipeptidyl-peptidase 4